MATETLTTMTGEEMIALSKKHTLFEWSAQSKVDPIPVARAKGIYFWTPEGKRFIDFNSQLMCVNIGHGDERVIRAIQEQARGAGLRQPVHGHRGARAAGRQARRDHAGRHRRLLLHQRRRRGERERDQARARGDRPPQDPRALPLVSRRHRRQHDADRRSAPLGRRSPACRASSTCSIRITASRAAGTPPRSRWRWSRRCIAARGAAHLRGVHPRDRHRHQRHPRAARRLHAGRARAVHEARHPDDLRRGDGRLRPHRRVVRGRSLEGRARHHHDGEGADRAPTCSSAPSACGARSPTSSRTRCSTAA